jgi:superkiller protein 3
MVLATGRKYEDAMPLLEKALQIDPNLAESWNNLGNVFFSLDQVDKAISCFNKALERKPNFPSAHSSLGVALFASGKVDEAIRQYQRALDINPDYAEAENNWALALASTGRTKEAIDHYRRAVAINPNYFGALCRLGMLLASCRDGSLRDGVQAVQLAERAVAMTKRQSPDALDALAAAYAETGRFSDAVKTAEEAYFLAAQQNMPELAESIRTRLSLYRAGAPFRK